MLHKCFTRKKAIDAIEVYGSDAKISPINTLREIEVRFLIVGQDNDDFSYYSKRIRLYLTNNSSTGDSGQGGSQQGAGNNNGTGGIITVSQTAKACKGFPSKVNIPTNNTQNLILKCSDNCGFIGTRIGQSHISDGSFSYMALVYNLVFNQNGTHVITAYDSTGSAISTLKVNVFEEHSYGIGERVVRPTCTESGTTVYACSICGFKNTESEEATGHYYNRGVITQKSTCTEDGIKTYTCEKCKDSYTEEIPSAGGHSFTEWEISEEPTALDEGEEIRTCEKCGAEESRSVEKLEAFVDLSKNRTSLKVGRTYSLKILDNAYGDFAESWKTSNRKIAKVSRKGKNFCVIKAVKKGKCIITLTMRSGCEKTCVVTVK